MVQPLTVLIVDDSPEDRQVYRRYLQQDQEHVYIILEAELGEEALSLFQQFQPDGILLDFLLPDLNGLEFLTELKQQTQGNIPAVIMLTGYGNETVAVQALKGGVQDYLIKGKTTAELLCSTINSAIKNAQLSRELQRTEESYRYLSDVIPQLVWIANTEGECIHVNQQWLEFTGQRIEALMGLGWDQVVHPDDLQIAMQAWLGGMQTGKPYECEKRMRRYDGIYRWYLVRGVPIKDELGQIVKWFGTSTDIEDRKQLEAERVQLLQLEQAARLEAETANQAKDDFVAMVSHDLRSPLNAILGWATLLRTRPVDIDTINSALEIIERNANSQAKLLEDLLNISRILRGKLHLEVSQVNLVSIVMTAIQTAYPAANANNIFLESIIDQSIPPIMGDENRLLQVLGNLLSNSIKFTSSGGRVKVRLSLVSDQVKKLKYTQITVSDTGIGISPEFLPFVFERYHQADRLDSTAGNRTHSKSGLGLGLAIARHLVELHGGTIQAASTGLGQGTTFTVKLPV